MAEGLDPVMLLQEITAAGWLSLIGYDKGNGEGPSSRLIEPLRLVDGAFGLLVQAQQMEPQAGRRSFSVAKIVSVAQGPSKLRRRDVASHPFLSGEIASPRRERPAAAPTVTLRLAIESRNSRPVWSEMWFREYAAVVRDATLDLKVSEVELANCRLCAARLQLVPAQVAAVHAYLLAEELFGVAADGEIGPGEAEALCALESCLGRLGWSLSQ